MKKKLFVIAVLVCVLVLAFTACAPAPEAPAEVEEPVAEEPVEEPVEEEPVEEPVEEEPVEEEPVEEEPALVNLSLGGVSIDYQQDLWRDDSAVYGGVVIYMTYIPTEGLAATTDNFTATLAGVECAAMDEAYLQGVFDATTGTKDATFADIVPDRSELMELENGMTVGVVHRHTVMTQEWMDFCIENGYLTEENIEAWGGASALLGQTAANQVVFYVPVEGQLVMLTAGCAGTGTKPQLIEELKIIAQTLKLAAAE